MRVGLQVVADVGERHRVAGERDRDRRAELEPLGVLGGEHERQERVVVRSRPSSRRRSRRPRAPWRPRAISARSGPITMPPSTFMPRSLPSATPRRQGPRRRSASMSHPGGTVRRMGRALPPSLSPSSISSFKECPLAFRFSYLERLPEPPSPWATQGHARAPGARAADVPARATSARSTPRSPTSTAARAELADAPRVRRARAHRRGVGAVPRRRRSSSCAATSSSRTRRPSARSASS